MSIRENFSDHTETLSGTVEVDETFVGELEMNKHKDKKLNAIRGGTGKEFFWSMLKRAYKGTFYKISKKHLYRYVNEFVVRHSIREEDTIRQMEIIVAGMIGRRIM